jgi:hypothetical protein
LDTDNVLPLALSINDEKVEKYWVMPKAQIISASIEETSDDVRRYANLALGERGFPSDIATAMHKIRVLYQFQPTTGVLRSAYDAARHMNVTVARLTKHSSPKSTLFERDRNNFRNRGRTPGSSAQVGWPRQRIRFGRYGMIGWPGMLSRSPR